MIYVGSFSKTLSSSLRVGFVFADRELIARLAQVKMISGLGGSRFSEAVLANLMASGAYRKLVQRQRQRLNTDRAAALQALEDADWEVFGKPAGGLFIWARSRMADHARVRTAGAAMWRVAVGARCVQSQWRGRRMAADQRGLRLRSARPAVFSQYRCGSTSSVLKTTQT